MIQPPARPPDPLQDAIDLIDTMRVRCEATMQMFDRKPATRQNVADLLSEMMPAICQICDVLRVVAREVRAIQARNTPIA